MTVNKHKYFNIVIFLLPFIDLITSITVRHSDTFLTLGVIIKGLMLLYFLWYLAFITSSKYKKMAITYVFLIFIFLLFYFMTKVDLLNKEYILTELSYLFKFMFFPVMTASLTCFYSDSGFDKKLMNKILLSNIIVYSVLLLIPLLTNSAYNTYVDGSYGYIGWYYSANEISAILVLLFPFLYILISDQRPTLFLFIVPAIIAISQIGTKVTFLGLIIVGIICLICAFLHNKSLTKNPASSALCIFLFIFLFMYNSYSINNMNRLINEDAGVSCPNEVIEIDESKFGQILIALLSDRNTYILDTNEIYVSNLSFKTVLFGIGFSDTQRINNTNINKLIEIDLLDIFYHLGICGLLIILLPFFYLLYVVTKNLKLKIAKFNKDTLFYGLMILLVCGISCISGHILLDPAVSIYISIYFMYLLNELNFFKKNKINDNKVTILSLHLGYGGAERATVDLANMLSTKYDVEIVSLYKTVDKCPFKINNNVKVNYLTTLKPNREEFMNSLKNHRYIKTFIEGLKAIKILYLKKKLIRGFVEYSSSKYMISSRIDFTDILNRYGRKGAIKIGVEHNYIVDAKYTDRIVKNSKNLFALVLVSKSASKIYKVVIPNLKICYIPNVVDDTYDVLSNLNTKNLISVGRLEKEKGMLDLIEVFKLVHDEDSKTKLDVFGDGKERTSIENKIYEYGLENSVTIHGFTSPSEIKKYYENASMYIMTSLRESFGIVLIESMKCGVPPIAFDCATGAKDIIKNNKNGFLIHDRNKQKMCKKIIEYLNYDKKEKKALQESALVTAQEFNYEVVKEKWFDLLESCDKK